MQLISKFNIGFRFLLCAVDIYRKYAWIIPLKDKKGITIDKAFPESNRKPNERWVDKGSEFYNRSIKSCLEKNAIEMYSTHNEGKSVIAERFIRTLKNKIYKYMTSKPKNAYIDKLDHIVNKYNKTYHSTIKIKRVDVNLNSYINSSKGVNDKYPKFKIGCIVKVSKYKNIFAKDYVPSWSEEVFVIKKVRNTVPWTYVISDLKGEEIIEMFYEKELQKKIKKSLELKNL